MRRRLAEWLFERELDEDFDLGKRQGGEIVHRELKFRLELAIASAPKAKLPGLALALEIVTAVR